MGRQNGRTYIHFHSLALGKVPFWLVAVFAYVAPYTTTFLRNITPGRPHFGHFFRTVGPVLPFVLYKVNEFVLFIFFTILGLVSLFKGCSLFIYSHLFYSPYSSFNFRRLFGARQSTARVSLATWWCMSSLASANTAPLEPNVVISNDVHDAVEVDDTDHVEFYSNELK